ncbi:MAG: phosphoribosylanthranilate isomerase [Halobacteria archaeon]|nr:phosphoribosylanthranilate isomerase [Halobacteria archaeon]
MVRVKICGVTDSDGLGKVVRSGADAVGFITQVPVDTPRNLSVEEVSHLVSETPPFVTTVAVVMPDTADEAVELAESSGADVLQVHSHLEPDEVEYLSRETDAGVVKRVEPNPDHATKYSETADALIVDSTDEDGAGGTGETHDWSRTSEVVREVDVPVVLAGGLRPGNVKEAVEAVEPYAVDVASGVESSDGGKDAQLVERFVAESRSQTEVETRV